MSKAPTKKSDKQEQTEKESKLQDQQKKAALTDYGKRLVAAKKLKLMTDTEAWQQLHKSIKRQIANHAESVLDHTLNSKDLAYHQQGVRVLRDLLTQVRAPVDSATSFEKELPLFAASEVTDRVEWDDKTGRVTVK